MRLRDRAPSLHVEKPPAAGPGWPDDATRPSVLDVDEPRWPASSFQRVALSPAIVSELVSLNDVGGQFDPWTGHRLLSWMDIVVPWKEHPLGAWRQRSDAFGLRRDHEPSARPPDLRVLVTGDSHTEGVCSNDESFCALLEAGLAQLDPKRSVEVLNAGRSSSSFANYLGALERWLALEPDVFVIVVYGGNDFVEGLEWHDLVHGREIPPPDEAARAAVEEALRRHSGALAQGLHSPERLARRPADVEAALQAARDVTIEMQALCARAGTRFVVAYLPPAMDVEWDTHAVVLDPVAAILALTPEQLASTSRMADSYLRFLRSRAIECVDLRPLLRAEGGPFFWRGDLHLNLAGHRQVARALEAVLANEVSAPRPRARQAPGTARPALPQWGTWLAPGAPVAADYARWSSAGAGDPTLRGERPPWRRHVFVASEVQPTQDDVFDARCGLRYHAGLDREATSNGRAWRLRTDSQGLKSAPLPAGAPPGPALFVLGDEQVDGELPDEERLPARIATACRLAGGTRAARAPRVRDASHAGHAFDAYDGALAAHGVQRGDTVLLVVVADSDFRQTLELHRDRDAQAAQAAEGFVSSDPGAAAAIGREALHSLARFGRFPRDAQEAGLLGLDATLAIDAAARSAGAGLVVVVLPSVLELDALELGDATRAACTGLDFDRAAPSVLSRVTRRYVADLRSNGVTVLDAGLLVPPHPGRLTGPGPEGSALREQIAEVVALLIR